MSSCAFRHVQVVNFVPRMLKDERTKIDPSRSIHHQDTSDRLE